MAVAYDKNKDYTAAINKAVAAGDYASAAKLEQQKNAKIAGEGLSYTPTNNYSQYLNTYKPKDNSGNNYAEMVGMSDLERAALEAAGKSWAEAKKAGNKAGMDAAHQQAESIRKLYGYSGGSDGSQYLPNQRKFSYEDAPAYVSKYQNKIDELTQAILGREEFSYDPEKDPTFQQYRESYTKNGQRAMQDTVGQVAARTGGLASSYAGVAGQQTYDNYMSALADKIPELRQLAYSMYQDEGNTQRANVEMLMALEQGDYNKYLNLLGQYNTDRNFNYGVFQDEITNQHYNDQWDYQVGRDQISDSRYDQEYKDSRDDLQFSKDLEKAQTLAAAGDFSGYKALGYTDAEIASLKAAWDREQMLAYYSGGSSGGGSGRSSGGSYRSSGNLKNSQSSGSGGYHALFQAAYSASGGSRNAAQNYISSHYKEYGLTSSSGLIGMYDEWKEDHEHDLAMDQAQKEKEEIADGMKERAEARNKLKKMGLL